MSGQSLEGWWCWRGPSGMHYAAPGDQKSVIGVVNYRYCLKAPESVRKWLMLKDEPQSVSDEQALWAVNVLDAEAADRKRGVPFELKPNAEVPLPPHLAWYVMKPYTTLVFYGPTPHAARLDAALAIYPTLSEFVREHLGRCP